MASTSAQTCGECSYLVQTHPEQRFLLCTFWASGTPDLKGVAKAYGEGYIQTHCHMQPSASACPFWLRKEIGESK